MLFSCNKLHCELFFHSDFLGLEARRCNHKSNILMQKFLLLHTKYQLVTWNSTVIFRFPPRTLEGHCFLSRLPQRITGLELGAKKSKVWHMSKNLQLSLIKTPGYFNQTSWMYHIPFCWCMHACTWITFKNHLV